MYLETEEARVEGTFVLKDIRTLDAISKYHSKVLVRILLLHTLIK